MLGIKALPWVWCGNGFEGRKMRLIDADALIETFDEKVFAWMPLPKLPQEEESK